MKPGRMNQQNMKGRGGNQGNDKGEEIKQEDQGKQSGNFNRGGNRRGGVGDHRDHRGGGGEKPHWQQGGRRGGENQHQNRHGGGRDRNDAHDDNMDHSRDRSKDREDGESKKFTGRCRLFVGNLPNDTSEEDFKDMFKPFGETSEFYVNTTRGFGFVRLVCIIICHSLWFPSVSFSTGVY